MTLLRRRRQRQRRTPTQQKQCIIAGGGEACMSLVIVAIIISLLSTPIQCTTDEEDDLISQFDEVTSQTASMLDFTNTVFDARQEEVELSKGTVYATCPDLNYIKGPMYAADSQPKNGYLNQNEYVEFTNAISGGYLSEMGWDEDFTDMPLSLQETYLVLSCLCELYPNQSWGGKGCCTTNRPGEFNTGIRTDGTSPDEPPNEDELQYLTYVCGTMNDTLEKVGGSIVPPPPTDKPTGKPTAVTPNPTPKPVTSPPVATPTPKPTTLAPSKRPTAKPSKNPTKMPSKAPSPSPTKRPTPSPTKNPTPPPVEPGSPTESPTTKAPSKSPTKEPTKSPVTSSPTIKPVTSSPTKTTVSPTKPTTVAPTDPTASPTVSFVPTIQPTAGPSDTPTFSSMPTISPAPSSSPTMSSRPTSSAAPTLLLFTGDIPASVDFVASLKGLVSAEEIMEGKTNQVKILLEEQLLVLSDIVIMEEFWNGTNSSELKEVRRKIERKERELIVKEATLATLDTVEDVECPVGTTIGTGRVSDCLNFNNTIVLFMVDEVDVEEKVDIFEAAMLAKISDGWLVDNFDLEKALQPPPAPTPPPNSIDPGTGGNETIDSSPLSAGAIAGIVLAILTCPILIFLFADRYRRRAGKDNESDEEYDLERQQSLKDSDVAQDDMDPSSAIVVDDSSSMNTEDKSFSSQDHLLQGEMLSTALMSPALGDMKDSEDAESSIYSSVDQLEDEQGDSRSSPLAAMAAASTLVASTPSTTSSLDNIMQSYSPMDFGSDSQSASTGTSDFPTETRAAAVGMGSPVNAASVESSVSAASSGNAASSGGGGSGGAGVTEGGGGLSTGAAAAIGAAGAGVIAAGAYAATTQRSSSSDNKIEGEEEGSKAVSTTSTPDVSTLSTPDVSTISSPNLSTASTSTPNALEDIDNAIEAGNWGQVGALAAVLASQGHGSPPERKTPRNAAGVSASRSADSSGASGSQSLDQARAVEIDKLVEAGDWQGVVLAAARFEADQTFDGESFSASASQSSRWTGSATSATTPRSMATTDQSASNISSQRGQEEIRAEVEALVRRVVPEEADNIDEMMTQFKGREEELVETLRRMQERAIASRARLAVQKSAKLEARAKASPRGTGGSTSGQSVGSGGSTKSELEHAIESGNWQAVGVAAQKMSDSSVGDLSMEEKARLRDAISQSPAFSRRAGKTSEEDDNLDSLIEQGDWQGVIAAAKKASEGPDQGISMEEQDALAQANMWQEIANQSKQQDTRQAPGAGDAAAWAISRSLNALNTSEEASPAVVRTINDIADEQSSDASAYESSSYGDSAGRSHEDYQRGI